MATYPIKMLKDENGTPFVPLISLDSVQDTAGQSVSEILDKKLETTNLIAGTQIELEVDGNNITISNSAEGTKLIDNLETEQAGVGALDAHQGKVLLEKIPTIANNLNTPESGQALSAYQGYVLAGRVAPTGGAEGQVLKKASTDDYDFEWGDAADPNAIVGDGSIMKIIELTYEEYLELESNGQLQDDTEYHISDWNENERTYLTTEDIEEMVVQETNTKFDLQNAKILENGTDLNSITTPGTYRSFDTATTSTMSNVPAGQTSGFVLLVCIDAGRLGSNLRQEVFRDERTFIRYTNDQGENWSEWQTLCGYAVGDVIITGSNDDPSTRMGGRWTLIDKEFSNSQNLYSDATDIAKYVTAYNDNVTISEIVVRRIGHSINLRVAFSNNIALTDTTTTLMQFNLQALGIKGLSYTQHGILIGSDGGNAVLNLSIYDDGNVSCVDVIVRGSDTASLPVDSSPRLFYRQDCWYNNMLDDFCDRFYWKRIA